MAWNKSLQNEDQKSVSVGAPISYSPNLQPKTGYHDGWDIVKAYKEGVSKVTWVFRCIDVIASNQAKLPVILRKDNNPFGEIVADNDLLKILNNTTNKGENAFAFRYRLSAQLLMSSRGVFIEIIRGRDGTPTALHLLPPQNTSPIPDISNFVKGYEVKINATEKKVLRPENVIWIRRPHPLDPYLSMTPMEAAGVAIEVESLAKIYNRNFLVNDGRPGGLLVLRSEIAEDDKDELRSRFRGNIGRTGSVGVISSDDGADFVDTAASPRDAAYVQMRTITKEEILAAFGVPESIIGNSSGRTFSNAMEEGKVFWMETMTPHLAMIARGFDAIDPKHYLDFDTSDVPILILSKQEAERHYLSEFQMGLISVNEYRELAGRKKVESDIADSLLANPNQSPIANTEKPMNEDAPMEEGVPMDQQAQQAQQQQVTEFSPEEGAFVPVGEVEGTESIEVSAADIGKVQGTMAIESPAADVPSELEGAKLEPEGEKSLPFSKTKK
jgi:HK97 family phage portal protein